MHPKEFENLLSNHSDQVFLFASPVPFPFFFAVHSWFVIKLHGEVHRWEFGRFRNSPRPGGIGIQHDFLPPLAGMNMFPWSTRPRYPSNLVGHITSTTSSTATELARFIHCSSMEYPLKRNYSYTGPNSNTYVAWVLRQFPASGLKMPWNAFGKSYPV